MKFWIAETTNKKNKYYPRHFRMLADALSNLVWLDSLDDAVPGDCTIVVRSPGYHGLGRATAKQLGIHCSFDLLTNDELQLVRERGGKILVDLGWEMLNPARSVVISLADTLREMNIDPVRVFIFHSNQNARATFNRHWLDYVGTPPPYSLEYPVAAALCVVHQQKYRQDAQVAERAAHAERRTDEGSRSKLFVSFNGEVRPHRFYVAAALEHFELLERGYFSLIYPKKSAKESDEQFRERSLALLHKLPRGGEFTVAGQQILDRLPIELDIGAIPQGGIEEIAWISQDPAFYDDSRFTIVIDTVVTDANCLFVTEKVLKPIMNHSPFLLVGSPGGANLLRSYGFRTFEPFIRQCEAGGFDDIVSQAVDEIVRLSRLSASELDELSRALADTCNFNARHFWEVFPTMLKHKFEEALLTLGAIPSAPARKGATWRFGSFAGGRWNS
jgi:hypothetical protein